MTKKLYLEIMERCRKLELGLLEPKSEHLPNESQLSLDVLKMMLSESDQESAAKALDIAALEQQVREHTRKKPTGRKPLGAHLTRVEIVMVPLEVQEKGLDAFECIGQEVSETLERRPAATVVVRTIRPKYVAKDPKDRTRNGKTLVLIGEPPDLPIPKGLAGPGMLADTIVKRWQDHLPLNRLEDVYAREGLDLARSTTCGWHSELAELVKPLVSAMRTDAFTQPYLCVDANDGRPWRNPRDVTNGILWVFRDDILRSDAIDCKSGKRRLLMY